MSRVELLAPAGDLEKLKIAIDYGADAVFIGGKSFSLRARSSNFTIDDIQEACEYAHANDAKVYVTTNILPHEADLSGLDDYLGQLKQVGVDAVICASIHILKAAVAAGLEVHISTQTSVTNAEAVSFYKSLGATRVVLARELSSNEVEQIQSESATDLEVFIHGGMCSAYSGRCTLSNHMTGRDSNRGGCAHSCRWDYVYHDNTGQKDQLFSMGSKDLRALEAIEPLVKMGISSMKIEGRMKSIHYIATVVKTYRQLLDAINRGDTIDLSSYQKELEKAENRETAKGFYFGHPGYHDHLFNREGESPNQLFVGLVLDYHDGWMTVEERNKFSVGMEAEVVSPTTHQFFTIEAIKNEDDESIDSANQAKQIVKVKVPFVVQPQSLIRKVAE